MKINFKPKFDFKLIIIFTIIYVFLYGLLNYNIYINQANSLESQDYTYIYQSLFKDSFNKINKQEVLENDLNVKLIIDNNNRNFSTYQPFIQELGIQSPFLEMGIVSQHNIEKMAIIKLKDYIELDNVKFETVKQNYEDSFAYSTVEYNEENNILFMVGTNSKTYYDYITQFYYDNINLSTTDYANYLLETNSYKLLLKDNLKNTIVPYFSMLLALSFFRDTIMKLTKVLFNCLKNFKSGLKDFFKSPSRKFTFKK